MFICMCGMPDDGQPMKAPDFPPVRLFGVFAGLAATNLAAWAWAIVAFHSYPVLLGTALLAYSFGLRHAVDADHIAAIDNVARKLMQAGRRSELTGLYFSLGHSTVVVVASLGIALGAGALTAHFPGVRQTGGFLGTSVSVLFLFAIAIANLFILGGVYRAFQRVRDGGRLEEADLNLLTARGPLSGIFRPVFRAHTHFLAHVSAWVSIRPRFRHRNRDRRARNFCC